MSLLIKSLSEQRLCDVMTSNNSTVYGVVLNDSQSVDALGSQLQQPPYKEAPIAPVLYVKPKNTFAGNHDTIALPSGENAVEIGATLALIISQQSARVSIEDSAQHIAGLALVADLSLPHDSYYRPAIREKCFDGALPMADTMIPLQNLSDLENLTIETLVNDEIVASKRFNNFVRQPAKLISDVTDYMSFKALDAMLVGVSYQAPIAKCGDTVTLRIAGISQLSFKIAAAGEAS